MRDDKSLFQLRIHSLGRCCEVSVRKKKKNKVIYVCIYISINDCVKHGKLVNPRGLAMGFERNMIERNSGPKGNNKKSQKPGHLDKLSEILIRVFL